MRTETMLGTTVSVLRAIGNSALIFLFFFLLEPLTLLDETAPTKQPLEPYNIRAGRQWVEGAQLVS